jgi:hypothetical protein
MLILYLTPRPPKGGELPHFEDHNKIQGAYKAEV